MENNQRKMQGNDQSSKKEFRKPSHVRRLNFAQSILTLNMVTELHGQEHGMSLTEKNITGIPCTKRTDYIHEWIETRYDSTYDSNQTFNSSPPFVFPSSDSARSPVFINRRKRPREKYTKCTACSNQSQNVQNDNRTKTHIENERKENIKRNLFNSQPVGASFGTSDIIRSPVLCRDSCSYRRRRRKRTRTSSEIKPFDRIEKKFIKTVIESPLISSEVHRANRFSSFDEKFFSYQQNIDRIDLSINPIDSYDRMAREYMGNNEGTCCIKERCMLKKRLEESCENDSFVSASDRDSKISEDPLLNIDGSPKDMVKETAEIEIETSNEDEDSEKGITRINTDTDRESSSDHIEDTDTQDLVFIGNTCDRDPIYDRMSSISKSEFSDATFFSKVEQPRSAHIVLRSSQDISQTSTQIKNVTSSRSSKTGTIVTTETSPRKNNRDKSMPLTLLDSGKKRKKPRRGSLLEKLQSTINRQVSFVRIWNHRLKQEAKQSTSLPCVTISVQACITRFGKQFLEGIVIKDPFNLLLVKIDNDRAKFIRFIAIPDIAGNVEMKSTGLVQIFPPWEILDHQKLMLSVTYIRVVMPDSETDIRQSKVDLSLFKRSVIQHFDCTCTDTRKTIPVCKDRFDKPNVMEKLFT